MGLCPGDSCKQTFASVLRAFLSSFITNSTVGSTLDYCLLLYFFFPQILGLPGIYSGERLLGVREFQPKQQKESGYPGKHWVPNRSVP